MVVLLEALVGLELGPEAHAADVLDASPAQAAFTCCKKGSFVEKRPNVTSWPADAFGALSGSVRPEPAAEVADATAVLPSRDGGASGALGSVDVVLVLAVVVAAFWFW